MDKEHASASGSVGRVMRVLSSFDVAHPQLKASDLYSRSGLPKATVHRILHQLTQGGFLQKNEDTRQYGIGAGLFAIGSLFPRSTSLVQVARPIVKELSALTGEVATMYVPTPNRKSVICVLREESRLSIRWELKVGTILPGHASSAGKAILSTLSDEEIIRDVYPDEELERLTAKTIGTRSELLSVLAGVRRSQLAYSDEETLVGVWGVASPVRDISGAAVASIALGAVTYTLEEERRSSLEIIAKAANQLVSFQLGYVDSGTDVRTIEGLRELWQRSQSRERASIVRCEVSSARQSVDGVQM